MVGIHHIILCVFQCLFMIVMFNICVTIVMLFFCLYVLDITNRSSCLHPSAFHYASRTHKFLTHHLNQLYAPNYLNTQHAQICYHPLLLTSTSIQLAHNKFLTSSHYLPILSGKNNNQKQEAQHTLNFINASELQTVKTAAQYDNEEHYLFDPHRINLYTTLCAGSNHLNSENNYWQQHRYTAFRYYLNHLFLFYLPSSKKTRQTFTYDLIQFSSIVFSTTVLRALDDPTNYGTNIQTSAKNKKKHKTETDRFTIIISNDPDNNDSTISSNPDIMQSIAESTYQKKLGVWRKKDFKVNEEILTIQIEDVSKIDSNTANTTSSSTTSTVNSLSHSDSNTSSTATLPAASIRTKSAQKKSSEDNEWTIPSRSSMLLKLQGLERYLYTTLLLCRCFDVYATYRLQQYEGYHLNNNNSSSSSSSSSGMSDSNRYLQSSSMNWSESLEHTYLNINLVHYHALLQCYNQDILFRIKHPKRTSDGQRRSRAETYWKILATKAR